MVMNLMQKERMMETILTVPPGFRFHPTEQELVGYYLRKKVASQRIDLDVIREVDLHKIQPWDLQEMCRVGYEEQNEWYFFSRKDKKYPTGTRTNRATMAGFWKATGRDKTVYQNSNPIGMRKTLVFYRGRAPNGQRTDWIMHEYRLVESHLKNGPPQEEGWVVCRTFKKRSNGRGRNAGTTWDNSMRVSSVVFPQRSIFRETTEGATEGLSLLRGFDHDQFVDLPQLQNPSIQPKKIPVSTTSSGYEDVKKGKQKEEPDEMELNDQKGRKGEKKVTDWRSLDRFVASRLLMSHKS